MPITNAQSGTRVDEIEAGIFRISTPVDDIPGGFTFNQFLVVDDQPLLFHTGYRKMFPLVAEAIRHVMPVEKLRYVAFSHVEGDETGALESFLSASPQAVPLCGQVAAMTQVHDMTDRPPTVLADGQSVSLGRRSVRWFDAPHVPHNWECGFLMEDTTQTMFCGDLLTQPGSNVAALTESDVLGPSEALRAQMGGVAIERDTPRIIAKLAAAAPRTLACMHGSSFRGDGGAVLRALADALQRS